MVYLALATCLALVAALAYHQAREAGHLRALLAQQEARLQKMESEIGALLSCSCGLGDRLFQLQKLMDSVAVRQDQIRLEEPGFFRFHEAAKLMDHGVEIEEIAKSCGLSQGEAELLAHFRKVKQAA
jgi:hypothetical protein